MFSDLLVIELASVLAGPSVGMFFAELGAEVIKIEHPRTGGDVTRSWKLPSEDINNDIPAYFSTVNWGKSSLALDVSTEEGKSILYALLKKADLVIVSFKSGDAEKLKLDYKTLKELNPKLIYAAINAYGDNNPKTGYDAVLQAESGFMAMNGTPGSGPLKMPVALIDVIAAHHLKEGILLAYIKRLKTNEGSEVKVSLFEAALLSLANQASNYLIAGYLPELSGSLHPNIAPYGETFLTKDQRHIILAIGNDRQFESLCQVLHLPMEAKFANNTLRINHRQELYYILSAVFKECNSDILMQDFDKHKIPAGLVASIEEALNKPEAAKLILEHLGKKGVSQLSSGLRFQDKIGLPPHLGQNTKSILQEHLNITSSQLKDLEYKHIILSKNIDG